MMLTECNRCHSKSTNKKHGATCGQVDAFQEHPCNGTMRRKEVYKLGLKHLVKHMEVWEVHLLKLESIYTRDQNLPCLREVRSDRKKLREWRERLATTYEDPRSKSKVSPLQSTAGKTVPK